ncbi:MAG: Gfo/Idh/MocA family protein, partial [Allosphingosinicella sp.]
RFRIVACVDPDDDARRAFMARWPVAEGGRDLADLGADRRFDIVSICSPTALHAGQVRAALDLGPRLIFCEKPITPDLAASEAVAAECRAHGVPLAVNHTRRWAPDVDALRKELRAGRWGAVRSAIGLYGKGVLNNGAHMVDLLHFLLDSPIEVAWAGGAVADFWPDDPTVAAVGRAGDTIIHLATAHAGDFALFELQLVTQRGVIAMEEGGFRWRHREAVDSPDFSGYRTLDRGRFTPGAYAEAMRAAVANLYDAVQSGTALASTGETAIAAQRVCDAIRRTARADAEQDGQ